MSPRYLQQQGRRPRSWEGDLAVWVPIHDLDYINLGPRLMSWLPLWAGWDVFCDGRHPSSTIIASGLSSSSSVLASSHEPSPLGNTILRRLPRTTPDVWFPGATRRISTPTRPEIWHGEQGSVWSVGHSVSDAPPREEEGPDDHASRFRYRSRPVWSRSRVSEGGSTRPP